MRFISQYRGCLYQYSMRTRFKMGKDVKPHDMMKASIGRFHPVFLKDDSNDAKIIQLSNVLNKLKIDLSLKNGFIYFLDEAVVPYNHHMTIDNMPIDYDPIVNSSLHEMKEKNTLGNDINKRNILIISIIEKFIDKISKCSTDEVKKQCDWICSIKDRPANSLDEALQRILFINQIIWQTDHLLNGLGRLDKVLNRFSNCDTSDSIYRFLKTLHCYYEYKSNAILGDTGQVIILGGIEPDGSYFYNSITIKFIKCLKELRNPDPKALLRVSKKMPDELLSVAIDCIATGCGSPLLSNDDIVIPAIEHFGYEHIDACNYGVSACWEPLSIGNSLEQNNLFDIEFGKVFVDTYCDPSFSRCHNIDEVINLYIYHLKKHLQGLCKKLENVVLEKDPICSLLNISCYNNDKDMADGGSKYNNFGLLSVGLASAVNSLINIKEHIFENNDVTLNDYANCLKANYVDNEELRKLFSKNENGFGSNNDYAIFLTSKIIDSVAECLKTFKNRFNGRVKFGLSSPAYVNSGKRVGATGDGRFSGMPFGTHISRESRNSLLDIMEFAGSLNYYGLKSNGNVVDVMIQPSLVSYNKDKFTHYVKSCINIGVFQMQFNVLSYQQLIDAKVHPEKYPNLIVRVWGFSAYFKDLPEEYQQALIDRVKQSEGII